ncbi:Unknown protein sequence [Pseudomonas syringae pv. aceris]|nr:Unknown protein sequence [Pseudomonas syringae pv. aceris]
MLISESGTSPASGTHIDAISANPDHSSSTALQLAALAESRRF